MTPLTWYLIGCAVQAVILAKLSARSWGVWLSLIPLWPLVVAWGVIEGLVSLYVRLLAQVSPLCAGITYRGGKTITELGAKHGGANA